ncbi:MAG: DUF1624 domain-containing protein [Legionella sp.]|nr:MAG: DUF1624 domain-containing protein [Legionella sp.]
MNLIPNNKNRLLSLDVFRGLTIVCMIIVNSAGTDLPYPILDHATWNGCTLADLVFPFFLFIVGLTSTISLRKHQQDPTQDIYWVIFKRSLILFLLGLWLNAFPIHSDLTTLRIYGILQRIAICYFISSLIYLKTEWRTQLVIFIGLLIGYWILMTLVPVPGFGAKQLTPDGSWVAYMDQLLFPATHLYNKVYDPEGFLSTFTAVASTLSGVLIGQVLLSTTSPIKKCALIFSLGLVAVICAWFWSWDFPINKNIWTSTFVLWTSGLAAMIFASCYGIIDIAGFTRWAWPLKVFGMNALFAFVFHVMLLKSQSVIHFNLANGQSVNINQWITHYLFSGFSEQNASLLFSLSFLLLNFVVVLILYRRKIFIHI